MAKVRLADFKGIAERFTKKHYPQWVSRVDRIWEMFENIDFESFSESGESDSFLTGSLGAVGETEPEFKECMTGIAVIAFTYQSTKNEGDLSEDEIKKRVSIVPNLNVTPGLQKKLESVLDEMLPLMTTGQQKQKSQITFTATKVYFSESETVGKDYPYTILEFIILENKIHWLWGFVLFGSWANVIEKHPKTQFGNYYSKISSRIKDYGFYVEHARGTNTWELNWEKTRNHVSCNLFKSNEKYTNALIDFEKGNYEIAFEKATAAVHPIEYGHLKYISAYKLLIKCVFKLSYDGIPEGTLKEITSFLGWYKVRLKNAIFTIKHIYIPENKFSESEIEVELKELEDEFNRVQASHKAICDRAVVSENDKEYEELIEFILNLKLLTKKVGKLDVSLKEGLFETDAFRELSNNKIVRNLFEDRIRELQLLPVYNKDREGTEDYLLFATLENGINLDVCGDLYSLNRYLKNRLNIEIKRFKDDRV